MEKLPLKHHSSSQKDELLKGETLFDESLNKSLTIAMNAPLSFDDFAHSADGLKILDACFSGAICSTVTLQSTFERLVHTYQAYLLFIAYQILEHWCAAEDIVQETWGKTFVYLKRRCEGDEQVDISRIRGFLAVTARNTALNYKKHEHHLHFVPLETLHGEKIEEIETIEADKLEQPEFLFIQNESRISLGRLLHGLPLPYRMVIILRFYRDYSYEETATILKCSVGTVKCYQHRGLARLRQAVKDRGLIAEDFDVWGDYSRRDNWLWSYMMRYQNSGKIA